jgi:hypothetical protein
MGRNSRNTASQGTFPSGYTIDLLPFDMALAGKSGECGETTKPQAGSTTLQSKILLLSIRYGEISGAWKVPWLTVLLQKYG